MKSIDNRQLKIITFNPFCWNSGYDYLLNSLYILLHKRRFPYFFITISGEGPLYAGIRYTINDLGLENNVALISKTSSIDEIEEQITKNDVYINFSVDSSSNIADKIAIKSGKVSILSIPNIKNSKTKTKNIFYVPPRCTKLLIDNLVRMLRKLNDGSDFSI